jgi:hypothetical protein
MRHFEKMNENSNRKEDRSIYSGERSSKKNKPKRGRREQQED